MFGPPTLAGFQAFLTDVADINPLYLPPGSPVTCYALQVAQTIVNRDLIIAGTYTMAVYNLGASNVINFAPDQPGRTYFLERRKALGITDWTAGVVSSTTDVSTSTSILNPDFMKSLTMANLEQLKDPYGRRYMALAQDYGPTVWGVI